MQSMSEPALVSMVAAGAVSTCCMPRRDRDARLIETWMLMEVRFSRTPILAARKCLDMTPLKAAGCGGSELSSAQESFETHALALPLAVSLLGCSAADPVD